MPAAASVFARSFFHGTRADLRPGDLIVVGYQSNFTADTALSWVYFAGTLDAAIWGAELATGDGLERIYVVEPTGPIMDDPNLTDKKFPGNPTLSYRSREPLRIVAEGVNRLKRPDNAQLLITHYQRLLNYIVPDFVHVLADGRIIKSGDKSLALELEQRGYDWITDGKVEA